MRAGARRAEACRRHTGRRLFARRAAAARVKVLTVGRTMALLDPAATAGPARGNGVHAASRGAESNLAIGLAGLGVHTAWVSRVGRDALGDASFDRDPYGYLGQPTRPSWNSPGARLVPGPPSCSTPTGGLPGPEEATAAHREVLPQVDWYLCGSKEGRMLFGSETDEETLEAARAAGAHGIVVRIAERGALVRHDDAIAAVVPRRVVDVHNEVGSGDAFPAGSLGGCCRGATRRVAPRSATSWPQPRSPARATGDASTPRRRAPGVRIARRRSRVARRCPPTVGAARKSCWPSARRRPHTASRSAACRPAALPRSTQPGSKPTDDPRSS